jgi:hypothetical protein
MRKRVTVILIILTLLGSFAGACGDSDCGAGGTGLGQGSYERCPTATPAG